MMITVYEIEISKRDQQIAELLQRNKELEEENKRLKELLHNKGKSKESKKPEFKIDYSVNQNQVKRKRRHKSTGRRRQEQKLNLVSAEEAVYPPTVKPECCIVKGQQYAWRILSGKAKYVCYTLYALEESQELPKVPGLRNSRSEYGLEISDNEEVIGDRSSFSKLTTNRSLSCFINGLLTVVAQLLNGQSFSFGRLFPLPFNHFSNLSFSNSS